MKTLYILRHAKSSWDEDGIDDTDRPLKKKGINDAYHKGKNMHSRGVSLDLMITSPAFRALNTSIIVAKQLGYPLNEISINPDIYNLSLKKATHLLSKVNNDVSSLMIVGHNPELSELLNHLTKEETGEIPTSGLVCITFKASDWKKMGRGTLKYCDFSKP